MRTLCCSPVAVLFAVTVFAAPNYPDKSKLLVWQDDAGKQHPITTPADWAKRRAHILANMQEVMGPLPDAKSKVSLDVRFDGDEPSAGDEADRWKSYRYSIQGWSSS